MNAPTLLSSCARAASAAEARFRIDRPNSRARATRIIALDAPAGEVMAHVAGQTWSGAHFLTWAGKTATPGIEALALDARLTNEGGGETRLTDELAGADVVVMIASGGEAAEAASLIGNACSVRAIMTAGLIVTSKTSERDGDRAIQALRPHAAVLVVASGEDYVPAMLRALRA